MPRRRSRLPADIQRRLVEHFVAGTPARIAADLIGVHRNTAVLYFHKLREVLADKLDASPAFDGEIEADESYFGGHRKGKRGRGAAGKVPVFGLLKRKGRVYAVMIPDVSRHTLLPIIADKVVPDAVVYTDALASYDTLDVSGFRHERIRKAEEGFVNARGTPINGIENFWSQAKRHLRKYNGIPRQHFALFLKECEWRFNDGTPRERLAQMTAWLNL